MDWNLGAIALALLISAGLGIDNGLVVDFSIRSLGLSERLHTIWRSITLVIMALLRIVFLFIISRLEWLNEAQPTWFWLPNRWFAEQPDDLLGIHIVLFLGGLIVIGMAFWEYYHKWLEERQGDRSTGIIKKITAARVITLSLYLLFVGSLFSIDNVFSLMSMLDIKTEFTSMVLVVLGAALVMIFGMVPLSKLVHKSLHIKVQMLTVLVVIGAKLMVDGSAGHFSNGILTFIIFVIILNDVGQAGLEKADRFGNQLSAKE